jgi:hypothetical protein
MAGNQEGIWENAALPRMKKSFRNWEQEWAKNGNRVEESDNENDHRVAWT